VSVGKGREQRHYENVVVEQLREMEQNAHYFNCFSGIESFGTQRDLFMIGGKIDAENMTEHIYRLKLKSDQGPAVVASMRTGRHSVGAGVLDNR